ncbi:MAG: hypothetical protein SFV51_30745 [Bryobacteraceae bacterium]|nr:hypothetical protein [Bryobacteraceae bacterium]
MEKHVRTIGILNAGLGVLCLTLCAGTLILFQGPSGVLLINAREGSTITTTEGFVTVCVLIYLAAMSIPLLLTGFGLLRFQGWARNMGIIVSIFALPIVPFGTGVGIYNLWVLNSFEVEPLFRT